MRDIFLLQAELIDAKVDMAVKGHLDEVLEKFANRSDQQRNDFFIANDQLRRDSDTRYEQQRRDFLEALANQRHELVAAIDKVADQVTELRRDMDAKFQAIDVKFEAVEVKFNAKFDAVDDQFIALDKRFDSIENRVKSVEKTLENIIEKRVKIRDHLTQYTVRGGWIVICFLVSYAIVHASSFLKTFSAMIYSFFH